MNSKRACRKVRSLKLTVALCFVLGLKTVGHTQNLKIFGGPGFSRYDAGVNASFGYWIWEPPARSYRSRSKDGLLFGVGAEVSFSGRLSLEIDALYSSRGSDFQVFRGRYPAGEISYDLDVLAFPVLFKVKLFPESTPYAFFGGELSYVLAHRSEEVDVDYGQGRPGNGEPRKENIKDRTEAFDLGLVIGGGFEIKLKSVFFFIEARYILGLGDILRKDFDYPLSSLKTRGESILIGLKI